MNRSRYLPCLESLESRDLPSTLLIFTKTAGFHHDSIPDAVAAIRRLGRDNGFRVSHTEDAAAFTDANLSRYQAVIFLLTTGDVLNADQQAAFERFIQAGNGYAGVHSAADTEYDWPWYGQLMGAYFQDHPDIQPATVQVLDHTHPSTATLPDVWVRTDEWYNYQTNPKTNGATVLANLDESTYSGGTMGADHPIMWYHAFDGGRSWYTGGGHTEASYTEPLFLQSLLGGIQYALGDLPAPTAPAQPRVPPDLAAVLDAAHAGETTFVEANSASARRETALLPMVPEITGSRLAGESADIGGPIGWAGACCVRDHASPAESLFEGVWFPNLLTAVCMDSGG